MFDTSQGEWAPPLVVPPPEEVIVVGDLVEERPGAAEPVRWSEYLPDGMLADLLAQPAQTDPEHREFETLERVGGWERVIAWAQARQAREMTSFVDRAQARNKAMGACDSQAHDSAVAEVSLMLTASARTAAARVGEAWSLCTRLPATLAALEAGRITLAKARVIDAETLNLSSDHTAAVEARVLTKAPKQTPGQLRAATRRAVLSADPRRRRRGPSGPAASAESRYGPSPTGWPPCRPTSRRPTRSVCSRCSMSTPANPGPMTSGPWTPAAATRWSTWCWAQPVGAVRPSEPPATTPPQSQAAGTRTPRAPLGSAPLGSAPREALARAFQPLTPLARRVAGVCAGGAGAVAAWMFGSPSPTPRCSAPTTNPATSPATGRSQPRWPATSPPGAPGGGSSPTRRRAGPWTTAPPATGHQPTSPSW